MLVRVRLELEAEACVPDDKPAPTQSEVANTVAEALRNYVNQGAAGPWAHRCAASSRCWRFPRARPCGSNRSESRRGRPVAGAAPRLARAYGFLPALSRTRMKALANANASVAMSVA